MDIDKTHLLLLLVSVTILAICLKLKYKIWRGKKLKQFALKNGFKILDIADIAYNESDSISLITEKRQKNLFSKMSSSRFPHTLTTSGYFKDIHVEVVLTKNINRNQICLLEVVATIDKRTEWANTREQNRYEQFEGNIVRLHYPDKKFKTENITIGVWRLCYEDNQVIAFRYDILKLKALWPINKIENLIQEVQSLIKL